jgi:iduronate 2-sulfatase
MRRLLTLVAATALLVSAAAPALAEPPRRLNVLFVVADDLNTCIGCYGHPLVKTPHIDRLAARGVCFERAYCQFPLCTPSRTSFLTGKRPETTQVLENVATLGRIDGGVFLLEHFRKQGYVAEEQGKVLGVKYPVIRAIRLGDEFLGVPSPRDMFVSAEQEKTNPKKGEGDRLVLEWEASDKMDEDLPDGKRARTIARLLEKHQDKPFFLALGFARPHTPWIAPSKYFKLYPPEKIVLPQEPADVRKGMPAVALGLRDYPTLSEKTRREATAAYYASVSYVDAQVGVLLDAMDRLKLWDNTVVILTSDHGFHLGEHGGIWAKRTLFEEATRVPLIVAAPGKKGGVSSPRLVELVDLYPTLTDLCNLPTPNGLEGKSFVPLLDKPEQPWKKGAFTVVNRTKPDLLGRSVRTERYRYTEWGDEKTAELYDHRTDPREFHNLAQDPGQAETVKELHALLNQARPKRPQPE